MNTYFAVRKEMHRDDVIFFMISGGARKKIISLRNSVMHFWFWEEANP